MALFDKLAKKATAAMGRTAFEADKLRRITEIKAKMSGLRKELSTAHQELATQVIELQKAGSLEAPELAEPIQTVLTLEERIAERNEELAAVQAEEFQPKDVEVEEGVCEQCGAELPEDSAFCANCGAKIG